MREREEATAATDYFGGNGFRATRAHYDLYSGHDLDVGGEGGRGSREGIFDQQGGPLIESDFEGLKALLRRELQ